ncbi:hypothetical protein COU77_01265 [Candidatus Peregrinibacteria bacterium CG10_big_fil_rev_8_21_14_0_10_49_16]|nr:MAG: hypothetical protein COW95_01090 [Candidatus Peregrinibacteria bacterium CG22_combo_CG10-13_8_21_14_all_49_11]PIR52269.1 MAG: hypothetical protein COU77_01265 [Candidatus Peregrinibacteria bacterium CG10_big_fil_rev_8_21_14_0_10_49_16]
MNTIRNVIETWARGPLTNVGKWLHPNQITLLRLPLGFAVIAIYEWSAVWGIATFFLYAFLDWLDGAVARADLKLQSDLGAKFDPYIDKIVNLTILWYFTFSRGFAWYFITALVLSTLVNVWSQLQRGSLWKQLEEGIGAGLGLKRKSVMVSLSVRQAGLSNHAANWYGKLKTLLEFTVIVLLFVHQSVAMQIVTTIFLCAAALLGACGVYRRIKPI